jgi:hypothetical protein
VPTEFDAFAVLSGGAQAGPKPSEVFLQRQGVVLRSAIQCVAEIP